MKQTLLCLFAKDKIARVAGSIKFPSYSSIGLYILCSYKVPSQYPPLRLKCSNDTFIGSEIGTYMRIL